MLLCMNIKSRHQSSYRAILIFWAVIYIFHLPGWSLLSMEQLSYFSAYTFYRDGQLMLMTDEYRQSAAAYVEYMAILLGFLYACTGIILILTARRILVLSKLIKTRALEPFKVFLVFLVVFLLCSYLLLSPEHSNFWNIDRRFNQNPFWFTFLLVGVLWPGITVGVLGCLLEAETMTKFWKKHLDGRT